MSTSSTATAATAREVATSLKALGVRLTALVDTLTAAGDAPVPADSARSLAELAAAIGAAVESPSASTAEKRTAPQPAEGWPRDMAAGAANEPTWGRDPEGLRHV